MSFDISRPLPEFNGKPVEYVKPGSQPTQHSYIQLTGNIDPNTNTKTIGVNIYLSKRVVNPFTGTEVKDVVCDLKVSAKLTQDQISNPGSFPKRVGDTIQDLLTIALAAEPTQVP